jgi:hypothetical protein
MDFISILFQFYFIIFFNYYGYISDEEILDDFDSNFFNH